MQPKALILLAAALQSVNVLAAPTAAPADTNAVVFSGPGYYKSYRNAAAAGLVDEEKREENEKRTSWTLDPNAVKDEQEKEKRQTGFRTAQYAHLYREAADEGLAEEKQQE